MQELSINELLQCEDYIFQQEVTRAIRGDLSDQYVDLVIVAGALRAEPNKLYGNSPFRLIGTESNLRPNAARVKFDEKTDRIVDSVRDRLFGQRNTEGLTPQDRNENASFADGKRLVQELAAAIYLLAEPAVARLRESKGCRVICDLLSPPADASASPQNARSSGRSTYEVRHDQGDMHEIKLDDLISKLSLLADQLSGDPELATHLLRERPLDCQILRDRLTPPIEADTVPTQNLADEAFSPSSNSRIATVAQLSPDEFFVWFDRHLLQLGRQELVDATQAWITAQEGLDYGSLEANQSMAKGLRKRMDDLDLWFACPWEVKQEGAEPKQCGKPTRLVCDKRTGDKYSNGAFRLEHADRKAAKKTEGDKSPHGAMPLRHTDRQSAEAQDENAPINQIDRLPPRHGLYTTIPVLRVRWGEADERRKFENLQ